MLMPRRVKHRKQHHPKRTGAAKGGTSLAFGDFGIQAIEGHYVTNRQIESARIAMTRHIKRGGKVWINIYPDRPLTKKPAETRMGSGKGAPDYWVVRVKPGRIMFEIDGVSVETAREALGLGAAKLPIKTKLVIPERYSKEDDCSEDGEGVDGDAFRSDEGAGDGDGEDGPRNSGSTQAEAEAEGEDFHHRLSKTHLNQHNVLHAKPAPPMEWIVVRIEVSDTGYGIRPQDMVQGKLFCESCLLPLPIPLLRVV